MIGGQISQRVRVLIVLLLVAVCFGLTYFFHHVLGSGRVVTHFYYIPIILAALWWRYRGLVVALVLAAFLVFSSYWFRGSSININDYMRAGLFVAIASIVAFLSDRILQARRELHDSENRYRAVFEHMNLGVAIYGVEDNGKRFVIHDLNRAGEAIDQVDHDQVVGKDLLAVFPGAKDFDLCEMIGRVWRTGTAEYHGVRFYRDERICGWRENFAYRLPTGEVVSVYKDQTDQKQSEEKVLQLASIVQSSNDAIIAVELGGTITNWNRAAERIYGYGADEILGRPVLDIIPPELHGQTLDALDMIAHNSRVDSFESQRVRKDGSCFDVSVTMSPVLDISGQVVGASIIVHDISKRKRMERALLLARNHLEQRVRLRTRQLGIANEELRDEIRRREQVEEDLRKSNDQIKLFAYRVLHDLKSPTVSIRGLTGLLQKKYSGALDEKGTQFCVQIMKGADQIATLVEKVNQFIATRESPLTIEELAVKELFATTREEFEARLRERGIALLAEETGAVVRGDRLALIRVLRNFVENALKYGGEPLTNIRLGYQLKDDFHVFSVSDNGRGVRSENVQRIFGLFERDQASSAIEGTGLGLAIVKEIAEQHHGTVWLASTPLVETTFYFSVARNL